MSGNGVKENKNMAWHFQNHSWTLPYFSLTTNSALTARNKEIPASLFVFGQHFGGLYRDPEKTPDNCEAGEQIGVAPTLSPLLLTAFLSDPGI